jgi:hypothetical protein
MRICALVLLLSVWMADSAAAFDDDSGKPVTLSPAELKKVHSIVAEGYLSHPDTARIERADAARDAHGELKVCLISSGERTFGGTLRAICRVTLKPTGELIAISCTDRKLGAAIIYNGCLNSHVNMHFRIN